MEFISSVSLGDNTQCMYVYMSCWHFGVRGPLNRFRRCEACTWISVRVRVVAHTTDRLQGNQVHLTKRNHQESTLVVHIDRGVLLREIWMTRKQEILEYLFFFYCVIMKSLQINMFSIPSKSINNRYTSTHLSNNASTNTYFQFTSRKNPVGNWKITCKRNWFTRN